MKPFFTAALGAAALLGADRAFAQFTIPLHPFGQTGDLFVSDPTNDQMPPQRHVTVGWGRDYDDVAPVRGVVIGLTGGQTLSVAVDVTALD